MIENVHERVISAGIGQVQRWLSSLASERDVVWPAQLWPAMSFAAGLRVGAAGGHWDVPYRVTEVQSNRVSFQFDPAFGIQGGHYFELVERDIGTLVRHVLYGEASGLMALAWPTVVEPLHDALIEDAFDKLAAAAGDAQIAAWSPWVRALRRSFVFAATKSDSRLNRRCQAIAGTGLLSASLLHALWATGSSWPLSDRDEFARVVMGRGGFPSAAASLSVATLLAGAACSVARPRGGLRRGAAVVTAAGLALRGIVGLGGHRWAKSRMPEFADADLRVFSPICLTLAIVVIGSLSGGHLSGRLAPLANSREGGR